MSLMRKESMRDFINMRDTMDRLFDDVFNKRVGFYDETSYLTMDMYQTEDQIVIKAAMPGVKPEDIQISVVGDVLTLQGEVRQEEEVKDVTYHLKESRHGSFLRSIPLPVAVVSEKAKAVFENGVLTLELPKAEEVHPKVITVKTK